MTLRAHPADRNLRFAGAAARPALALLLGGLLVPIGGCNLLAWPFYVFAPPVPTKTVEPEFAKLQGKTVAIVIYASEDMLFNYPTAPLEVGDAVAKEMRNRISKVTVVEPGRVIRYQADNPRWERMPPGQLCTVFAADYVLLISLTQFSTREPGLGHLLRGRVSGEANLYQPPRPQEGDSGLKPAWHGDPIRIVYPEDTPVGLAVQDERAIRVRTADLFAQALVKKFYKHQVPVEP